MNRDPAFLMYAKEWLSGTLELTHEEKGVYIDFLCYQHQNGGLPNSEKKLARIAGLSPEKFSEIWVEIKGKFRLNDDDKLVNNRLEQEVERRKDYSHKKATYGIFGSLIKKLECDPEIIDDIKQKFEYQEFTQYRDKAELKKKIKEWVELNYKLSYKLSLSINNAEAIATATATATSNLENGVDSVLKKPRHPAAQKRLEEFARNMPHPNEFSPPMSDTEIFEMVKSKIKEDPNWWDGLKHYCKIHTMSAESVENSVKKWASYVFRKTPGETRRWSTMEASLKNWMLREEKPKVQQL